MSKTNSLRVRTLDWTVPYGKVEILYTFTVSFYIDKTQIQTDSLDCVSYPCHMIEIIECFYKSKLITHQPLVAYLEEMLNFSSDFSFLLLKAKKEKPTM